MKRVTTDQLKTAPENCFFIWLGDIEYPVKLAKAVGRDDIIVKPLYWLTPNTIRIIDRPIVIDHAAMRHLRKNQHRYKAVLDALLILWKKEPK